MKIDDGDSDRIRQDILSASEQLEEKYADLKAKYEVDVPVKKQPHTFTDKQWDDRKSRKKIADKSRNRNRQ